MNGLLLVFIGTIAVFSTEAIKCYMCDNEAGDNCDLEELDDGVTCDAETCSVTSYVRKTAAGCQSIAFIIDSLLLHLQYFIV